MEKVNGTFITIIIYLYLYSKITKFLNLTIQNESLYQYPNGFFSIQTIEEMTSIE